MTRFSATPRLGAFGLTSASMIVVLLAGLLACLVCESDRCAEVSDHEDCQCQCVCALAALPGTIASAVARYEPVSFDFVSHQQFLPLTQPSSLFRPPRA